MRILLIAVWAWLHAQTGGMQTPPCTCTAIHEGTFVGQSGHGSESLFFVRFVFLVFSIVFDSCCIDLFGCFGFFGFALRMVCDLLRFICYES